MGDAYEGVQPDEPDPLLPAALCDHPGVLPAGCEAHLLDQDQDSQRALRVIYTILAITLLCFLPNHVVSLLHLLLNMDVIKSCSSAKLILEARSVTMARLVTPQHVPGPRAVLCHHQPLQMEALEDDMAVWTSAEEQRCCSGPRTEPVDI